MGHISYHPIQDEVGRFDEVRCSVNGLDPLKLPGHSGMGLRIIRDAEGNVIFSDFPPSLAEAVAYNKPRRLSAEDFSETQVFITIFLVWYAYYSRHRVSIKNVADLTNWLDQAGFSRLYATGPIIDDYGVSCDLYLEVLRLCVTFTFEEDATVLRIWSFDEEANLSHSYNYTDPKDILPKFLFRLGGELIRNEYVCEYSERASQ